jgi:hypothetical protein
MVFGISPRLLSTAWKGGANVRDLTRAPVTGVKDSNNVLVGGSDQRLVCGSRWGVNQRFGVEHLRIVVGVLPRNRE